MTSITFTKEELGEKILALSVSLTQTTDAQPTETTAVHKQVQELIARASFAEAFELSLSELPILFENNPPNLNSSLGYAFVLLLNMPADTHVQNLNIIFGHLEASNLDLSFQLKSLNTLYNLKQTNSKLQYNIFLMIHKLCSKHKLVKTILSSHINSLLDYAKQWDLSTSQTLEFLNLFLASTTLENMEIEAIAIEKMILTAALPLGSPENSQLALSHIVRVINCVDFYDFDQLAAIPAISMLASSSSFEYSLLNNFVQESCPTWSSFVDSNKDKLASLNVDIETASNKLKILALVAIGNDSLGKKISYSTISKHVFFTESQSSGFDDFEIESVIIDSIKTGLISAKIDQLGRSVTITRSTTRKLGKQQWATILEHLNKWKTSLSNLLPVINNGKLMTQLSLSSASAVVEINTNTNNSSATTSSK